MDFRVWEGGVWILIWGLAMRFEFEADSGGIYEGAEDVVEGE